MEEYAMEYVTLNNKLECPVVGIGTYMLAPADAENSVREALKMGYSLVDTANAYVNERAVGRGMRDSGTARENVFLSTKLWPSEYENPNTVDETLARRRVSGSRISKGNTLMNFRQSGRSSPSSSRSRLILTSHRRSCARSLISMISGS